MNHPHGEPTMSSCEWLERLVVGAGLLVLSAGNPTENSPLGMTESRIFTVSSNGVVRAHIATVVPVGSVRPSMSPASKILVNQLEHSKQVPRAYRFS